MTNKILINDEDLTIFVSERIGESLDKKNVALFKDWVFVRDEDWPDDIDCYHSSQNGWTSLWEPWSGKPLAETPFGTTDKTILLKTVESLNKGWQEHIWECQNFHLKGE